MLTGHKHASPSHKLHVVIYVGCIRRLVFLLQCVQLQSGPYFNPLNPELNSICYLLALLDHHFLNISRIRVKSLTIRLLISYTGWNRRNVPDFGRVFLMLEYTDITQNTYIQSWTVWEIMASEVRNFDSCYTLTDYQIHIESGRNMWFL